MTTLGESVFFLVGGGGGGGGGSAVITWGFEGENERVYYPRNEHYFLNVHEEKYNV